MTKLCQIEGCNQVAKYKLFKTFSGHKKWLSVCIEHEKIIGREN